MEQDLLKSVQSLLESIIKHHQKLIDETILIVGLNRQILMRVKQEDPIEKIKEKLYEEDGIPIDDQILLLDNDKELENTKKISDYGINKSSLLTLQLKSSIITIVVQSAFQQVTRLYIQSTANIKQLYNSYLKQVERLNGVCLLFHGKLLEEEDEKPISDYGIVDGSNIFEIVKYRSRHMKLLVRVNNDRVIQLNFNQNQTKIMDIKKEILSLEKIPIEKQQLTLLGRVLENEKELKDYPIAQNDLLILQVNEGQDEMKIDSAIET